MKLNKHELFFKDIFILFYWLDHFTFLRFIIMYSIKHSIDYKGFETHSWGYKTKPKIDKIYITNLCKISYSSHLLECFYFVSIWQFCIFPMCKSTRSTAALPTPAITKWLIRWLPSDCSISKSGPGCTGCYCFSQSECFV